MKKLIFLSMILAATFASSNTAMAGGKPDGARCHVHKSCQSKLCLRQTPTDKFGLCCDGQTCAEAGAQCGTIDNQCGIPLNCGDCGFGFNCVQNQCVSNGSTTTTTQGPVSTTTTVSVTTTTNIEGCGHHQCDSPDCAPGCETYETPESVCGVCAANNSCSTPCTASSECGPGGVCIINTCSGPAGFCTTE